MSIRVVVVDDHAVVRSGLRLLLDRRPDIQTVGEAANGRDAVFEVRAKKPDVVLLDVTMPGESGIEAIPKLLEESPQTKVLILSMQDDPSYVRDAFAAGASGYVLKESAGGEVVAAVRAVHDGRRYLSEKLSPRALEDYIRERGPDHPLERLSRRELQVLKLIVEGNTSSQVGALLGLSPKSVDTYRSRMMAKLEIDDLASLVKFAIRHGVTSVE